MSTERAEELAKQVKAITDPDAGILHREKRGVWAYCSVVPGALDSLAGVLGETC